MSQMPARIVLVEARALIASRECFLRHEWKRSTGVSEQRCAYTAIVDAAATLGVSPDRALSALAAAIAGEGADPLESIPPFNDCYSHAAMLAMFDRAVEAI